MFCNPSFNTKMSQMFSRVKIFSCQKIAFKISKWFPLPIPMQQKVQGTLSPSVFCLLPSHFVLFSFVFWPCCVARDMLSQPGIKPGPLQWERRILTTRPPENATLFSFSLPPKLIYTSLISFKKFCLLDVVMCVCIRYITA